MIRGERPYSKILVIRGGVLANRDARDSRGSVLIKDSRDSRGSVLIARILVIRGERPYSKDSRDSRGERPYSKDSRDSRGDVTYKKDSRDSRGETPANKIPRYAGRASTAGSESGAARGADRPEESRSAGHQSRRAEDVRERSWSR